MTMTTTNFHNRKRSGIRLQSVLDNDFPKPSCCSPLASKKRNEPLLPKRGRSKKPRNTYGGGSRRPSAGVLKDNFSFL
jgi:hypothetical protein